MDVIQILEEWVKGNCIHDRVKDKCLPDFSCCDPELLAPELVRKRFLKAVKERDIKTQSEMMIMFVQHLHLKLMKDKPDEPFADKIH